MNTHTKSSITLPPLELKMVSSLMKKLGAKSKVEVVRRGLLLLKEMLDREQLRKSFREASLASRKTAGKELSELDHLTGEGLK